MTREELLVEQAALEKQFEEIKAMNLKLDMSRGKPSAEQLDLSMGILDAIDSFVYFDSHKKSGSD